MYSPHMLTPHNMQDVQEDALRTWVTSRPLTISPSASICWFMSLSEATPVVQWPPLPTHVKAVLNFGIQVPF